MSALLLGITLLLLSALPALATDLLIIQSSSSPAYAEALRGFREVYQGKSQTVVLSDYAELDVVRLVKEERPQVVLAVGDPALKVSKKVSQVPVVALMAISLGMQHKQPANIGGVTMVAAPEKYLQLFRSIGARRIGILHNPAKTGRYLLRAEQAAGSLGLQLVKLSVEKPSDVITRMDQLAGKVDALWMIPDSTAVTAVNKESYFLFALRQQIPVVTFSEQFLQRGATASLDVDRLDLGRQAGAMVLSLLDGDDVATADPRKIQYHTNEAVIRKQGLSPAAFKPAR